MTADLIVVPSTGDAHDPTVPFLERHIDTSIFLLSSLTELGPRAGPDRLSGNYWRIEEGGTTVAVFCLTQKGHLLAQTGQRSDLARVIVDTCQREATPLTGVVAEWTAARTVWDVLIEAKQICPTYESNKLLYGLTLNPSSPLARPAPLCRRLSQDDFDQWDVLYLAHMREEGAPVLDSAEQRAVSFRRMLRGSRAWWGAFDGSGLAATVALNASYKTSGLIGGLYTRVDKRRGGLARAITAAAMHDCWHGKGIRRLVLLVNDDNVAARGLYESLGFTPRDRFGFLFGATGAL